MRSIRLAVVTAVIVLAVSRPAAAQCVSNVWQIASRASTNTLIAETVIWTGSVVTVASLQDGTGNVWLSRFDENGTLLGRESKVPGTGDAEFIDLVWTGSEYGVFYVADDDRKLTLRRLTSEGDVAAAAVTLLPKIVMVEADDVDVVWDPLRNAYVVARTVNGDEPGLWITIVEPDGSIRSNEKVAPAAEGSLVRVVRTDSGTIAVFFKRANGDEVSYLRLSGSEQQLYRNVWTFDDQLHVTTIDNLLVLAKWVDATNSRQTIVYKIIDTSGQVVVDETRLLTVDEGEIETIPLSLSSGGGELAVAYLDPTGRGTTGEPGFRLRRFTVSGETIADTLFAAGDPRRAEATTERDIAWSGTSWFAAVERKATTGSDSYLLRMCPLAARIDAVRVAERGRPVMFFGSALGGVPGYDYIWTFSDGVVIPAQVVERTFAVSGSYSAVLTVRDSTGTVSSEVFTIDVNDPTPGVPSRRRAVGR